jgi:hypothetical protein
MKPISALHDRFDNLGLQASQQPFGWGAKNEPICYDFLRIGRD